MGTNYGNLNLSVSVFITLEKLHAVNVLRSEHGIVAGSQLENAQVLGFSIC